MVRALVYSDWRYGKEIGFDQRQVEKVIESQVSKIALQHEDKELQNILITLSQNIHYWAFIQSVVLKHLEKNPRQGKNWKETIKEAQNALRVRCYSAKIIPDEK